MYRDFFFRVKKDIVDLGYGYEILQVEYYLLNPCSNSNHFLREFIWVVLNAGLKNQVAERIYHKIVFAINNGYKIEDFFNHLKKTEAIKFVLEHKEELFNKYLNAEDKLNFLESLPFIGPITKYHLARNLGIDLFKPDRHILRISKNLNQTPEILLNNISVETGERIGIIDVVLWRAGNLGIL